MTRTLLPDEISGNWRTLGYNKLFRLSERDFDLYDLSQVSCVHAASGGREKFASVFDRFEFDPTGRLVMYARGGITRYLLERQTAEVLQESGTGKSHAPQLIFEVFWRYFQENYAFFKLRDLDWMKIYHTYRPRIDAQTSPEELEAVLTAILVSLNDSHATLLIDGREISTRKPHDLVKQWQKEFHSTEFLSLYPQGIPRLCAHLNETLLRGEGKWALDRQILWGWLEPGVGYLAPFSLMDVFGGFEQLHFGGFEVANVDYLERLRLAMDQVLNDLSSARLLVVDMRFNLGGHDAAGFVIAGHFTEQRRLALTKQAVCLPAGNQLALESTALTPAQEIYLEPLGARRYTGPLAVLTSPATASAAEVCLYGLLALPQAVLLGEPSRGVLSDMLLMGLPNGWRTSLSNEIYTACDGVCYEGQGISPHIPIPVFRTADFYAGLKAPVEQALTWMNQRRL